MTLKENFELMAEYNQWMNKSIYSAASQLSASDLAEDRGAFFGSIIGTLNHLLVGDTIWLKRFAEHPAKLKSLEHFHEVESPNALDSILHENFEELRQSRLKMDHLIREFSSELTDAVLLSSLSYKNTKGEPFTKNLGALVQHFFNHQTHHRGQITTLLNQVGIDVGVTDLLVRIPS